MRQTHLVMGLALVSLLAASRPGSADNWPRFRGPNGTGISTDKGVPVQWGPNEVRWKTPLPGTGISSPIVWEDRLFVQSATSDGKQRLLHCIDTSNGKILWSQAANGSMARTHKRNSLASSTPATDGKQVYALIWNGQEVGISAYDFSGKLVWQKKLGEFASQHGAGTSPIVYQDKVFVNFDQDRSAKKDRAGKERPSSVIALDAKTGNILWQANRKGFRACYSTPCILERPGKAAELVVISTAGISGYDPQTGTEVWKWTWTGHQLRTVASTIIGKDVIFATSGAGNGDRGMVAVKAGTKGEAGPASLAWHEESNLPYVPTMLTVGDNLFWVNDKGVAGCNDILTGKSLWTQRLSSVGVTASPVLIDGKIYAPAEDGSIFVYSASTTFKQLARNSVGEPVFASPAVSNNRLYIRGKTHVICIGKP